MSGVGVDVPILSQVIRRSGKYYLRVYEESKARLIRGVGHGERVSVSIRTRRGRRYVVEGVVKLYGDQVLIKLPVWAGRALHGEPVEAEVSI